MASPTSIIKKVNAILNSVGPPTRLVYLRTTTRVGGDALTGYAGTVTVTDTLLAPQPYYLRLGRDRIPGGHTKAEDATVRPGTIGILDDWTIYTSPDAVSDAQVTDPDFTLVFKTPATVVAGVTTVTEEDEVLKLIDYTPAMIYGANVLSTLYMRSTQRS